VQLGVPPERIDTVADFAGAQKYGAKTDGSMAGSSSAVLDELAKMVADGDLEVPIAAVYPLDQVQDAFRELERGHTHGKIVLIP
jgi:NADPH:quinone reductase-like Zn-dependent oxidoreductase